MTQRFYPSGEPGGITRWTDGGREPKVDRASRESIIRWLVWNDRNGCYTDEACIVEGIEPLTLETANESLDNVLSEP